MAWSWFMFGWKFVSYDQMRHLILDIRRMQCLFFSNRLIQRVFCYVSVTPSKPCVPLTLPAVGPGSCLLLHRFTSVICCLRVCISEPLPLPKADIICQIWQAESFFPPVGRGLLQGVHVCELK